MVALTHYRVVSTKPAWTRDEANDKAALGVIWQNHQKKVIEHLKAQAKVFDAAVGDDEFKTSHLKVQRPQDFDAVSYDVSSTHAFKNFLKEQSSDLVHLVEGASGFQFMAFAAFVPMQYQTNIGNQYLGKLGKEFQTVSRGIPSGRALTQVEADARAQMHENVYIKIAQAIIGLKIRHSDYLFDVQEKAGGCYYISVTTRQNSDGGVNEYEVGQVMRHLAEDTAHFSAVLAGPDHYPSEVDQARRNAVKMGIKVPPKHLTL